MKRICLVYFFLVSSFSLQAQSTLKGDRCYREAIHAGIKSLNVGKYGNAFKQFSAARNCNDKPEPDSINIWVNEVIDALDAARKEALKDKKLAEEKTEEANTLKEELEEKNDTLEKLNEELYETIRSVKIQGRRAESMLLASLSNIARSENKTKDAIIMAFSSLQIADDDLWQNSMRAFGEAVRDSMGLTKFENKGEIMEVILHPKRNSAIIRTKWRRAEWIKELLILDLNQKNGQILYKFENHPGIVQSLSGEKIFSFRNYTNSEKSLFRKKITVSRESELLLRDSNGDVLGDFSKYKNVELVCFSKDDRYLLIGTWEGMVLLDLEDEHSDLNLSKSHNRVKETQFSNDNKHFLTRSADSVKVWDIHGNSLATLGENELYIRSATFNKGGNEILTAADNGLVKIWNLKGELLQELKGHESPVQEAQFFTSEELILSRSVKNVKIWDQDGYSNTIEHSANIEGMTLNHSETALLTWASDHSLKLSDIGGNIIMDFKGLKSPVITAVFSPDDQYILTTEQNGSYSLWDTLGNIIVYWDNRNQNPIPARFSADGQYIVTVEDNNTKVVHCPLPEIVYKNMRANLSKHIDDMIDLAKKYNLRFLEESLEE